MPSVQTIRKQLLQALDSKLLPSLESQQAPEAVLVELPLRVPQGVGVSHLPVPVLDDRPEEALQDWEEETVNSSSTTTMIVVFEGQADMRMGVTTSMVEAAAQDDDWTRSGCHVLHCSSPVCLIFPPGVPFSNGSVPHWEDPAMTPPNCKLMWVKEVAGGANCHICTTDCGAHKAEYSLHLHDEAIVTLLSLLTNELRLGPAKSEAITRNYLANLLLCIQRRLLHDAPVIANTVYLPPPEPLSGGRPSSADRILKAADEYVHSHLRESITLSDIASYCGVSPTHLNRVLNAKLGISANRFIYRQRIRSAQRILTGSDLPIKEVASLVGFSRPSHFCRVFQKTVGASPTEFRVQGKPPVDSSTKP